MTIELDDALINRKIDTTDPDVIKIGGVDDYTEIDKTYGTLIFKGDTAVWDEVSQAFIGANIFSVAGFVDYNFVDLTLDFQTSARYPNDPIGVVIQAIHARKPDSDIRPHIHWMQTSNNNPNVLIEYRWINNGEVPSVWTLKALTAVDNKFPYVVGSQQITEFNLPAGHGVGKGLSVTFECKIYRDNANTSGLFTGVDTYVGNWSAKYYDIHFLKDMVGSREEFVK